jgi:hypothetical protein
MTSLPPSSASLHSNAVSTTSSATKAKHPQQGRARRMEVVPARSLGPFRIGAPLHAVVALLQGEAQGLPATGAIAYSVLPDGAVRLYVDDLSLALTFDRRTQRLGVIEVCSLSSLELSHKEGMLCGKGATPTFVRLYDVLGPTFAGQMNRETGEYILSYPGLDVIFRVPAEFRERYVDGDHPIQFPDGTTPVALALVVREDREGLLTAPVTDPFAQPWATARVQWGLGVLLQPAEPQAAAHRPFKLLFGMSPQDVMAALGPPESITAKGDERLMIHNSEGRDAAGASSHPSYCFGFPSYGVDLVFSSFNDTLTKICMHTGVRNHEAFLRYACCHFEIPIFAGVSAKRWLGAANATEASEDAPGATPDFVITPSTSWKAACQALSKAGEGRLPRPLLATAADGTLGLWALNGIIFTVTQQHDEIAAVTLVPPAPFGLPRADEKSASPAPVVLTFRSPPLSKATSPEAGPVAAPPLEPASTLKRVTLSAEFDECEDVDSPAIPQTRTDEVYATFFGEENGRARRDGGVPPPMPQHAPLPGPSFLRDEPPLPNQSTHFQFSYPGFSSDGAHGQVTESSTNAGIGSRYQSTEGMSSPPLPRIATLEMLPESIGSGKQSREIAAEETDYAEDPFESLQNTEHHMHTHHAEPNHGAAATAAVDERDTHRHIAHQPTPHDREEALFTEDDAPAFEAQEEEEESNRPLPGPDDVSGDEGGFMSAQEEPTQYKTSGSLSTSPRNGLRFGDPADDDLLGATDQAETDVSPGDADDDMTPPVTPPMNGGTPPMGILGSRKAPGAALAIAPKKGKQKKRKSR